METAMKDELVEKMRDAVRAKVLETADVDILDWGADKVVSACLSAIESAGLVIVPRGSVEMLLEVHMKNPGADDWAVNIGARPYMWHDQYAYIDAWNALRLAAAPKPSPSPSSSSA